MTTIFRLRRPAIFFALAALLTGLLPYGAAASEHHTATRTTITFTSAFADMLDPGREWIDADGTIHMRGSVELQNVSGDINGILTLALNGDFEPAGECSDLGCPGYLSAWADINVTTEDGGWEGTYVMISADLGDDSFFMDRLVLRGTGANAHQSIVAESISDDENGITFEGTLATLATPIEGINTSARLCLDPQSGAFTGGFLSSGALSGAGAASADVLVTGSQATDNYGVAGTLTLTDERGSLTIGFGGMAQDVINATVYTAHVHGHFVIVEGTGDYADLYASGRFIGAASDSDTCASGFSVGVSLIGEAHSN